MQSLVMAVSLALFVLNLCCAAPYDHDIVLEQKATTLPAATASEARHSDHEVNGAGGDVELSESEPSTERTIPMHYILSQGTGMFVAITKSGRVSANAQLGREVAKFYLWYSRINGREHVTIQSTKYTDWYLTVDENGKFRGAVPQNENEYFEVVNIHGPTFALKKTFGSTDNGIESDNSTVNEMNTTESSSGSGSGSGYGNEIKLPCDNEKTQCTEETSSNSSQKQETRICYLGFSSDDGRPDCYDTIDLAEVHFQVLSAS